MEHDIPNDMGKCFARLYIYDPKRDNMSDIIPITKYSISQPEYLYGTGIQALKA